MTVMLMCWYVFRTGKCAWDSEWVGSVCVLLLDLSLSKWPRCLFSPHSVVSKGLTKTPPQVRSYKSHTTEESRRRLRSSRYSQVLPGHTRCTPPWGNSCWCCFHRTGQRVCVVAHLLHSHVSILFGLPADRRRVDIHKLMYRSSQVLGCRTGPSSWFTSLSLYAACKKHLGAGVKLSRNTIKYVTFWFDDWVLGLDYQSIW